MERFSDETRARYGGTGVQMDLVEQDLAAWEHRFHAYEAAAGDAFEEHMRGGAVTARMLITSQATSIASRLVGLTEACVDEVNRGNVHAAPAIARALFETSCIPFYMRQRVLPRLRKQRVRDVKRLLWRLGLGTTPDAGVGHIRPIKVSSLVKAGREWLEEYLEGVPSEDPLGNVFQMIYGPLTDSTHPNWSATQPVQTIDRDSGTVTYFLRPEFEEEPLGLLLVQVGFSLTSAGARRRYRAGRARAACI